MRLKLCFIVLPVLLALDMVWLGLVASDLYQRQIGHLMAPAPNWPAALAFYAIYIAGLVHFVLMPAVEHRSGGRVARDGAFFGFVAYATFDLTSLALLRGWPLAITLIDLAWGATLTATSAWLAFRFARLGSAAR